MASRVLVRGPRRGPRTARVYPRVYAQCFTTCGHAPLIRRVVPLSNAPRGR